MAKKKESAADIIERARRLVGDFKVIEKANRKCKNHTDRIIYMKGLCKDCYEQETNTTKEAKAAREPWISTDGYKYCYNSDGRAVLYHRFLVEQYLRRPLTSTEKLGFLNDDKSDVRLENLGIRTLVPILQIEPSETIYPPLLETHRMTNKLKLPSLPRQQP